MKKYQAILMAAGVGSRLSAHTRKPKSTLGIDDQDGETIIGHTCRQLSERDFKINIVVGYRKESVKAQLRDWPVRFYENPFYRVTNSIGSLWFAREALVHAQERGQDVLLANADVYFGEDLIDRLMSCPDGLVMFGDSSRTKVGDYFFRTNDQGMLVGNGKGLDVSERTCEYVGIAKVASEMLPSFITQLDYLIWNGKFDMWWEDAFYSFKEMAPVKVLDAEGSFWGEVDTIEDYQRILDHTAGGEGR